MDPNATLAAINEELDKGDYATAHIMHDDLVEWLNKGGFMPDGYPETRKRLNPPTFAGSVGISAVSVRTCGAWTTA